MPSNHRKSLSQPSITETAKKQGAASEQHLHLMDKFLKLQDKEMELKKQELEFRSDESKNNKELALKSLEASAEDNKDERRNGNRRMLIYAGIGIAVMLFIGYLVTIGDKEISKQVITSILSLGMGLIGGYSYGKTVKNPKD